MRASSFVLGCLCGSSSELAGTSEDATIIRVGPGAIEAPTRAHYAAPQISSGGCPFLTMFDMSTSEYQLARAAFKDKKAETTKRVEQLKKELGDKRDDVTGKKS